MTNHLPFVFARQHRVIIREGVEGPELVTIETPSCDILLEIQRILGCLPGCQILQDEEFQTALEEMYGQSGENSTQLISDQLAQQEDLISLASAIPDDDLLDLADDAPIVRFINAIFSEALKRGASDIHIESFEESLSVRMRIDGVLQEVVNPDKRLDSLLVSRIKVLAKLDIAEKRIPQDGRITVRIAGRAVDVRVSVLPTGYGERVVMRLLDKRNAQLDLEQLGMPETVLPRFKELLAQPNGIILVTGPTGSGKTTTLYAGLQQLNSKSRNILTVEDPIEYALEGIGQIHVNTRTGMTFSKGLRAMLRQDPDVVMVGEIRDIETANIAVQASLTGHLVLSTLHTNSAASAITRLIDLGVEPFLIASSLKGVLAQRLVRKLCSHCKTLADIDAIEARLLSLSVGEQVYKAMGCEQCHETGYQGRMGIYELLTVTDEVRHLLHDGVTESVLASAQIGEMTSLHDEGCRLIKEGITSPEEVLRIVRLV